MAASMVALDLAAWITVGRGISLAHGLAFSRMQLESWSGGIGLAHFDFFWWCGCRNWVMDALSDHGGGSYL